jgi:hypothetical protein
MIDRSRSLGGRRFVFGTARFAIPFSESAIARLFLLVELPGTLAR